MLKRDHCKIILFPFAAWVFFVSLFLVAPAMPAAGEKTPPFYPEGPPSSPSTASKHYSKPPDKDFSLLFRESSAHEKTPPYYPEKSRKQSASVHRGETATLTESAPGIDENRVRTEEYVVQEGDWLVKILREKGLLNEQNLPRLLSLLRELNSSLQSLDMIQPGEKIVILVKVVPGNETEKQKPARELKRDTYRVKRGDILSQVVMRRYDVSRQQFNREYLKLFAACNPSVEDPNKLLAGQTINLPHYPPVYLDDDQPKEAPLLRDLEKSRHHIALKEPTILESRGRRVPIQPSPAPERPATPPKPPQTRPKPAPKDMPLPKTVAAAPSKTMPPGLKEITIPSDTGRGSTVIIADGIGTVVSGIGEQWIHSGEHFIPMTSGGHINLNAESYPIIRLRQGVTVIVDMQRALPQTMARVIESSWASYRVVHLSPRDDLRSALNKILDAFSYPQILKRGEPLVLGGNIPVSITGDWIVVPPEAVAEKGTGYVVINLMDVQSEGLPPTIKNYLKLVGVDVIEYPAAREVPKGTGMVSRPKIANDTEELIKAVLNYRGQPFKTDVKIPAYASRDKDFTFTVQADFYLEIGGRRYVIDTEGLSPDIVALLKQNGVSVLTLTQHKDPMDMVSTILTFLNVQYTPGPHLFMAKKGDASRNVKLTLYGVTFYDQNGNSVLATPVNLPPELVEFLSQRGYQVLVLSPLPYSHSGSA